MRGRTDVWLREAIAPTAAITQSAYRNFRRALRRIKFLRSGYQFVLELGQRPSGSPARIREIVDHTYNRPDPWNYTTLEREQERLRRQLEMLVAVCGTLFSEALEIGCGEGVFTELLAVHCQSLLALDISPVALERARGRCRRCDRVRFYEWDLQCNQLPGTFDLIVVTGVLEYLQTSKNLRAAREKLTHGLRPGGYLLVETTRKHEIIENSWWGKRLIRGRWINEFIAQHPALTVETSITSDWYAITLFRKLPCETSCSPN